MPLVTTARPHPAPAAAWRDRSGFCAPDLLDQPSGTLTSHQVALLGELAGRIQLGHDLLTAFADRYASFPSALAAAHTRELALLRTLLARYRIADPTARIDPGKQTLSTRLRAEGFRSRADALCVTQRLAGEMIALLDRELPGLRAPDVRHACLHILLTAHRQARTALAWAGR